jgi:O-antigen/teichoic acid export membrane protein
VIITVSNALGSQYYNPAGLRLKSSMFLIAGAVCNLILNLILIPRFQSAGAIVASVAAELIITVLYVAYCDRNLTVTQLVEISYKKLAAGIVMAGVIFLLYKVIPDTVPGLLAVVVLGGASYLISLIALRDKTMLFARNELLKRLNGIVKK